MGKTVGAPCVAQDYTHGPQGVAFTLSLFITWLQTIAFSSRHTCEWMRLLWAGQAVCLSAGADFCLLLLCLSFLVWAGWLGSACSYILVMSPFLLMSGICFCKSKAILEQDQSPGIIFSLSYCSEHHRLILSVGSSWPPFRIGFV